MGTFIIVIGLLFVGFCIYALATTPAKMRESKERLSQLGFSEINPIKTGRYVAGHPKLDTPIPSTYALIKESEITLVQSFDIKVDPPNIIATIPGALVKNILVEDESTVEKRVTVTRLLALGIFAFAVKKKEKKELAYLTVEWNDGRFDHETIFEFNGIGAMTSANIARNQIIKNIQ